MWVEILRASLLPLRSYYFRFIIEKMSSMSGSSSGVDEEKERKLMRERRYRSGCAATFSGCGGVEFRGYQKRVGGVSRAVRQIIPSESSCSKKLILRSLRHF